MFLQSGRRGLFVSTCDRFSRDVMGMKRLIAEKSLLDYFETVDYGQLVSILRLAKQNRLDPPRWTAAKQSLDRVIVDTSATPLGPVSSR